VRERERERERESESEGRRSGGREIERGSQPVRDGSVQVPHDCHSAILESVHQPSPGHHLHIITSSLRVVHPTAALSCANGRPVLCQLPPYPANRGLILPNAALSCQLRHYPAVGYKAPTDRNCAFRCRRHVTHTGNSMPDSGLNCQVEPQSRCSFEPHLRCSFR